MTQEFITCAVKLIGFVEIEDERMAPIWKFLCTNCEEKWLSAYPGADCVCPFCGTAWLVTTTARGILLE